MVVMGAFASGSDVLAWPHPRADALVERVRRQVGTAGPRDRARVGVNDDPREALRSARFLEAIASMDFAKRDEVLLELLLADWDPVIVDEAHKASSDTSTGGDGGGGEYLDRTKRLRRHNGSSHRHTNRLEGRVVRGFHVHLATERYQLAGLKEDDYAEATSNYGDLAVAIDHMLEAAGFESPSQGRLL